MLILLKIHLDDFFIEMVRVGKSNSSFLFAGMKHAGGVLLTREFPSSLLQRRWIREHS